MSEGDNDKRVWMYRKGEAKLFPSMKDVPKGEGWHDSPADDEPEPASKRKMKRDESVKLDDDDA